MRRCRGFTIVELLVVVAVIAMLIGILLPAIGKARDQARLTTSQTNLRQLGQAHAIYAGQWNDRHVTLVDDNWGRYGSNYRFAGEHFLHDTGAKPIKLYLELGYGSCNKDMVLCGDGKGYVKQPIDFNDGFGWFRIFNGRPFNSYLDGRFESPIFFAPKDRVTNAAREKAGCTEDPGEVCQHTWCEDQTNFVPIWSSYCLSPAALYSPDVMRSDGWQDPYTLDAGFRVPALSQARFPDLKTHMLEHPWLQGARSDCNPGVTPSGAMRCEPYYFNHSWESVPVTLFYDGHVEGLGVREAEAADTRATVQSGHGLWSRDTWFGADGYFISEGYDFANTSFHILTTDGIRGRDKTAK